MPSFSGSRLPTAWCGGRKFRTCAFVSMARSKHGCNTSIASSSAAWSRASGRRRRGRTPGSAAPCAMRSASICRSGAFRCRRTTSPRREIAHRGARRALREARAGVRRRSEALDVPHLPRRAVLEGQVAVQDARGALDLSSRAGTRRGKGDRRRRRILRAPRTERFAGRGRTLDAAAPVAREGSRALQRGSRRVEARGDGARRARSGSAGSWTTRTGSCSSGCRADSRRAIRRSGGCGSTRSRCTAAYSDAEMLSPKLADKVMKDFALLVPMCRWLNRALGYLPLRNDRGTERLQWRVVSEVTCVEWTRSLDTHYFNLTTAPLVLRLPQSEPRPPARRPAPLPPPAAPHRNARARAAASPPPKPRALATRTP